MKARHPMQLFRKLDFVLVPAFLMGLAISFSVLVGVVEGVSEIDTNIHSFVNSPPYGNWTLVDKPMFPVHFNETQIPVGSNWTVVCPLIAKQRYHIYCYGEWIDYGPNPSTDYDIYIFDPNGRLAGYHTQSAGLPEHLGNLTDDPFFVPEYSGNYTFVIRNDPRESADSRQATLMIIENIECNVWHQLHLEGKEDGLPVQETSWAYEFESQEQHMEVLIKVPETLDVYEIRLYLMANPGANVGELLNDVPLAWEAGLYGEKQGVFGGYNLDSEEYRGVNYASCEFHGQDMLINFTSSLLGASLYHLVFIGEAGSGTIEFVVKTEFENVGLIPSLIPKGIFPRNDTIVAYASNSTDLENSTLQYSTNDWENSTILEMEIESDRICSVVIPGQPAGTFVSYQVVATDILENVFIVNGDYTVKHRSKLDLTVVSNTSHLGKNVTVRGHLTPPARNLPVILHFTCPNSTNNIVCYTLENGTFTGSFRPETVGTWRVHAEFNEDDFGYGALSSELPIEVKRPPFWVKYGLHITGGISAIFILAAVIYFKKSRE